MTIKKLDNVKLYLNFIILIKQSSENWTVHTSSSLSMVFLVSSGVPTVCEYQGSMEYTTGAHTVPTPRPALLLPLEPIAVKRQGWE